MSIVLTKITTHSKELILKVHAEFSLFVVVADPCFRISVFQTSDFQTPNRGRKINEYLSPVVFHR